MNIPPIPDDLLRRLKEPVTPARVFEYSPEPGTIWEVCSPSGELLLLLVVERVGDTNSFVRAIPLTNGWYQTRADCIIIASESGLFTAHCWLEGPVSVDLLERAVGSVLTADMRVITQARAVSIPVRLDNSDRRQALFEQFDPMFSACWGDWVNKRLDV